jgi:hypothetical protein
MVYAIVGLLGLSGLTVVLAGWLLLRRARIGVCPFCDASLYTVTQRNWHEARNCAAATDAMNAEYQD